MSEPTTISTLEEQAKRIAAEMMKSARGSDLDWREKQAENWGFIRAFMENQINFNNATQTWQKVHQDKDDGQFSSLAMKIETRALGISSAVNLLEKEHTLEEGAKRNLYIIGGFIAWLIPTALSLFAALK